MILKINNKKAVTLVEMIIAVLIMTFIGAYAWRIYSNSGETMRHTVSQSQIQADIRSFLDNLETEMMSCYTFEKIDPDNKYFSFYSYTFSKKSLDDIYYDYSGNPRSTDSDSDSSIQVLKLEYSWADGKVTKKRTPGYLFFLRKPMLFQDASNSNAFVDGEKALNKEVLKDISEFEIRGYKQQVDLTSDTGVKVTPSTDFSTSFIVLRIHSFKDETGGKRDEELDIVTKLYSSIKLAENANPGYFCSTDSDGRF